MCLAYTVQVALGTYLLDTVDVSLLIFCLTLVNCTVDYSTVLYSLERESGRSKSAPHDDGPPRGARSLPQVMAHRGCLHRAESHSGVSGGPWGFNPTLVRGTALPG